LRLLDIRFKRAIVACQGLFFKLLDALCPGREAARSEQSEADFHHDMHRHRRTVSQGRFELPRPYGFDSLFIQAETQRLGDFAIRDGP